MRTRLWYVASLVLLLPASGQAQGFYLGGGLAQFAYEERGRVAGQDYHLERQTDWGWKAYGGYRINRYLGLEVAYADLGEPSGDVELGGSPSAYEAEVAATAWFGYLVGYIPIGPVELVPKLGVADWDSTLTLTNTNSGNVTKTDNSGKDQAVSLGLQYTAYRWAVRADWETVELGLDATANVYNLGAHYRF